MMISTVIMTMMRIIVIIMFYILEELSHSGGETLGSSTNTMLSSPENFELNRISSGNLSR